MYCAECFDTRYWLFQLSQYHLQTTISCTETYNYATADYHSFSQSSHAYSQCASMRRRACPCASIRVHVLQCAPMHLLVQPINAHCSLKERTGQKDFRLRASCALYSRQPECSTSQVREKGAWAYPGTAQFFKVHPVIPGMGKAMNCKFCTHIHTIDQNKSPLKILEK